METELTKTIKRLTHNYNPKLKSSMRTIRWADEVATPDGGYVDSVRFEDYYESDYYKCRLIDYETMDKSVQEWTQAVKPDSIGKCFRDGTNKMSSEKCHGCAWRLHGYQIGMCVTCYEIKVSLSDFKSGNKCSFFGNENYYCVPKELAPKISALVPEGIGILVYTGKNLRKYRESAWKEVDEKTKIYLLYNAMKKWCDRAVFRD